MADASLLQHQFLGGEWSKFYQGRSDRPDYRTALNVCLNYIPIEAGALVRRPGFGFAGTTRGGAIARVIKFDFQQASPYVVEFTDGVIRFWQGNNLVTEFTAPITNISAANPAVITVPSGGGTPGQIIPIFFSGLGTSFPVLQNRQFQGTFISSTTVSLQDPITGANIDGSTLGGGILPATALVGIPQELPTPYVGRRWQDLRLVQAENTAFLLESNVSPQQLTAARMSFDGKYTHFTLAPSFFEDGPYLDPLADSILTASALTGIITLTASVPAYSATTAYTQGDFVLSASVTYMSLKDANVGNTPASSPTFWQAVSAGAPINSGQGFLSSDIGRLIRLFSEPPAWDVGITYGANTVVSYNPSGLPGQTTYWQSVAAGNVGHIPGIDIHNWQLLAKGGQIPSIGHQAASVTQTTTAGQLTVNPSTPVIWTWGKITAISAVGAISGTLAGSTNIGNLTAGGGLVAAFDGTVSKSKSTCALVSFSGTGTNGYVGKNYTGAAAQTIAQAVVYPENQLGIEWHFDVSNGDYAYHGRTVALSLRAKNSLPANSSDGTLLGSATTDANSLAAVTITSNNTVSTWNYVWVEAVTLSPQADGPAPPATKIGIGQVIFYSASAAPGTAVSCEILGPPLLYSGTPINLWKLGVYSDTTGWPSCGTYADGRLWLSGAIPNRFDASVANGVNGIGNGGTLGSVNFAETDQYDNVLASSGISYVLNGPDVNPIFWMQPDLQGIIMGTKAGEWLLTAPTVGGFSPLNIAARRVTQIGSADIEPRRTEHTTIFVQKFGRKIMEYFSDVFSGKFTAPHITEKSKHLTQGNVAEIAYQQELAPIVWARLATGTLVGWTYKRDTLMTSQGPTFAAGHRHELGSGRTIESIAVGPSVGGNLDALTIITNDPATNIRHVEVMTDIIDEGSQLAVATYLDDAVTPTSSVVNPITPQPYGGITLNGLWHLNGQTVTAWLGGLDCGDYLVSNGSIMVPFGDGVPNNQGAGTANGLFTMDFVNTGITANGVTMFTGTMPMRVGFTYTSAGQIVRPMAPAESGARSGPAFGKMRRAQQYAMQLEGTGTTAVSVGTDFSRTLLPALFRQLNDADYTIDLQFNGIFWNTLTDQYSRDGAMLSWQVTRPYIANVVAVGEYLETQD